MLLKKVMLFVATAVAACSTVASARERIDVPPRPSLGEAASVAGPSIAQSPSAAQPTPGPVLQPTPMAPNALPYAPGPAPVPTVVAPAAPLELYGNVKYRQTRKMAPCSVPMIVSVKDPCSLPCDCCEKCVNVEICVPQCQCPPTVTTCKDGCKVRYDFGQYAVNITSRRGVVIVDYDR